MQRTLVTFVVALLVSSAGFAGVVGAVAPTMEGMAETDTHLDRTATTGPSTTPEQMQALSEPLGADADLSSVFNTTLSEQGEFYGAATLSDGGVLAVGVAGSDAGADGLIARVDANGTVQWQKQIGTDGHWDAFWGVAATADGGALLVGDTNATADGHGYDGLVVKITSSGAVEWKQTYGGTHDDWLSGAVQTAEGNYLLVGERNYLGTDDADDAWTLTISSNGTVNDRTTYSSAGTFTLINVVKAGPGTYYAAGFANTSANSGFDGVVMNLRVDGSDRWMTTVGGNQSEFLNDVAVSSDGSILTTGYADTDTTDADPMAARITSTGTVAWRYTYGTDRDDYFGDITIADGRFVTTAVGSAPDGTWETQIAELATNGVKTELTTTTSVAAYYHAASSGGIVLAGTTSDGHPWTGGYAFSTPETGGTQSIDASRTVGTTKITPGSSTTITVTVNVSTSIDRLSISERFTPDVDSVSNVQASVDGSGSVFFSTGDGSGIDVAAQNLAAGDTITLTYELGTSSNATVGQEFTISGNVSSQIGNVTLSNTTVTVVEESGLSTYAGSDGMIQTDELRTIIQTWVMGDLTTTELRNAIQAWVMQKPV